MRTRTLEEALNIVERLNNSLEFDEGVKIDTLQIKNIAPLSDLKKFAKQERASFLAPDGVICNYAFVAVTLGRVNCILRSVEMTAEEYYREEANSGS